MSPSDLRNAVDSVRRFNRFYTKRIGLLNQGYLDTNFSLTQARILFEVAQSKDLTATDLIRELDIDRGYLSRTLGQFEEQGLIKRTESKSDRRFQTLKLTPAGKNSFSVLNKRSSTEIGDWLKKLSDLEKRELLEAMNTIQTILGFPSETTEPVRLRTHGPGDVGWIVARHGALYAQEYQFDETFEGLVAEILANFLKRHDSKKECIWIAERNEERLGTVTIVDAGQKVAQLRCLLVEPKARGLGIGRRLIEECIRFSKQNGYTKMKLWTQSHLNAARHLYEKAGFQIVDKKPQFSFGQKVVSEIWELALR
jgi:DNA-binding MarR family transcriptional regulator/GNAT superfamily N-acetyltransferase